MRRAEGLSIAPLLTSHYVYEKCLHRAIMPAFPSSALFGWLGELGEFLGKKAKIDSETSREWVSMTARTPISIPLRVVSSPAPVAGHFALCFSHLWVSDKPSAPDEWHDLAMGVLEAQMNTGTETGDNVRQRISEGVRNEVWRRDEGKCAVCRCQVKLEFDHVVPLSRGGSNTARNLQLLCEPCNRKKGASIG